MSRQTNITRMAVEHSHSPRFETLIGGSAPFFRGIRRFLEDWRSRWRLPRNLGPLWLGLLAGVWYSCAALADPPPTSAWALVTEMSDEFNKRKLDTSKWQTSLPYYLGRAPGLISPRNVTLGNGKVNIWTKESSDPMPSGYTYTTGLLRSRLEFEYGYLEARIKVDRVAVDQAIYLYDWRSSGNTEIDVAEIAPGAAGHERLIHTNLHSYVGLPEDESDLTRFSKPLAIPVSFDPAGNFHTYGVERDDRANKIRFYIDGSLVREEDGVLWTYPMYLNISSEIMLNWFGPPTEGTLPTYFSVDYVRVWRRL